MFELESLNKTLFFARKVKSYCREKIVVFSDRHHQLQMITSPLSCRFVVEHIQRLVMADSFALWVFMTITSPVFLGEKSTPRSSERLQGCFCFPNFFLHPF